MHVSLKKGPGMDEKATDLPEWEHYIEYIIADAREKETRDFLATYYPGERMPKFAAQASLLRLNAIGAQGWELVHMQPVLVLNDGSVTSGEKFGTNTYLCVFKRQIRKK
jgi:hypothetical protein